MMELLFTDFCEEPLSSCNPNNHSITFMLRTCSASAVPIAVIIMKRQSEESYVKGFQFVNRILENIFYGKGSPEFFMMDDSDAEIKALNNVFLHQEI